MNFLTEDNNVDLKYLEYMEGCSQESGLHASCTCVPGSACMENMATAPSSKPTPTQKSRDVSFFPLSLQKSLFVLVRYIFSSL